MNSSFAKNVTSGIGCVAFFVALWFYGDEVWTELPKVIGGLVLFSLGIAGARYFNVHENSAIGLRFRLSMMTSFLFFLAASAFVGLDVFLYRKFAGYDPRGVFALLAFASVMELIVLITSANFIHSRQTSRLAHPENRLDPLDNSSQSAVSPVKGSPVAKVAASKTPNKN